MIIFAPLTILEIEDYKNSTVRVLETGYSPTRISSNEKFDLIKKYKNKPIKVMQALNKYADFAAVKVFESIGTTYYRFEERVPIAQIKSNKNLLLSESMEVYSSNKKLDLLKIKIPKQWLKNNNRYQDIRRQAERFRLGKMIDLTHNNFPDALLVFERYRGYKIIGKESTFYLGTVNLEENFEKLMRILESEEAGKDPIVSIELDYNNKVIVKRSTKNKLKKAS